MREKIKLILLFAICIFILNTDNKDVIAIVFISVILI